LNKKEDEKESLVDKLEDAKKTAKRLEKDLEVKYREGTQTYLYKNAFGQLRLTRLYFCGYFAKDGSFYGTMTDKNGDGKDRRYARRDVLVDVSNWKAHTWHHIICGWDDTKKLGDGLSIWVDGTRTKASYYMGKEAKEHTPQFCILNERDNSNNPATSNTMDGLFLNGFYRNQYQRNESNVIFQYAQEVHNPSNATMDGVKTYDDNCSGTMPSRERFSTTASSQTPSSLYTNTIEITKNGVLGPLKWTAYPVRSSDSSKVIPPFVICTALLKDDHGNLIAKTHPYPKNYASSKPGYYGEGLPVDTNSDGKPDIISVKPGYTLEYTVKFFTPSLSKVGKDNGVVPAALDSIRLLIIAPRFISFETK